jgi:hypothetical protein
VEEVDEFPYLGVNINNGRKPIPRGFTNASFHNRLIKARGKSETVLRFMKERRLTKAQRNTIYQCYVQSVLLYGSETWALTKFEIGKLETFHNRALRNVTATQPKSVPNGRDANGNMTYRPHYPRVEEVLRKAGSKTIEEIWSTRQAKFFAKINNVPFSLPEKQTLHLVSNHHRSYTRRPFWTEEASKKAQQLMNERIQHLVNGPPRPQAAAGVPAPPPAAPQQPPPQPAAAVVPPPPLAAAAAAAALAAPPAAPAAGAAAPRQQPHHQPANN